MTKGAGTINTNSKIMHSCYQKLRLALALGMLLVLGGLIYLPGISGPYVFDDASNLLGNIYVQINSLDRDSLYRASFSLGSGPLQRPIAMLSFALNHYFAGSFADSTPFKLTNLAIHVINAALVCWLVVQILKKAVTLGNYGHKLSLLSASSYLYVAAGIGLLWLVHPIQLTSVLYLVQRMTELSALFTLLALNCYFLWRTRLLAGKSQGAWLLGLGPLLFGILGIYSKENAALLPAYILVLEATLFRGEAPWDKWHRLTRTARTVVISVAITAILVIGIMAVDYALPHYGYRDFTMTERLLTQGRALVFYLSLILLPRLDQFALFHDDFEVSHALLDPWTTLASLITVTALLTTALYWRRRYPLLSLGILWFFAGHLLESTVLPLEIMHEHRNYLPSIGPLLIIAHAADQASHRLGKQALLGISVVLLMLVATVTWVRASQWTDDYTLFLHESIHHPESPTAHSGLALRLIQRGDYGGGMQHFRRAAELHRAETSYLFYMHMFAAQRRETLPLNEQQETLRRLREGHITNTTGQALDYLGDCISSWCQSLRVPMENWLRILIDRPGKTTMDISYLQLLLGRTLLSQGRVDDAVAAYRRSYELDRKYLHPLIELTAMYIQLGNTSNAARVFDELKSANRQSKHPRDKEIQELEEMLGKLSPQPIKLVR